MIYQKKGTTKARAGKRADHVVCDMSLVRADHTLAKSEVFSSLMFSLNIEMRADKTVRHSKSAK